MKMFRIDDSHKPPFEIAGTIHGVSGFSKSGNAAITETVPHPFYFNLARTASGTATSLSHTEVGLHLDGLIAATLSRSISLRLFGGPTVFFVTQDVATPRYTESYPYDTITIEQAGTEHQHKTHLGFNVGAEGTFMLSKTIGVNGIVRFSRASVPFTSSDGSEFSVKAGGTGVGAGICFRF